MAVVAGNNVSFLIGSQTRVNELLNSKNGVQAGAFYVTNDTHRIYFGAAADSLVALNQGVKSVESVKDLVPEAGQFYYVKGSNVLCVHNGSEWVQINPDTANSTMETSVVTADNTATVGTVLTDNKSKKFGDGTNGTANFSLAGENLTITSNGRVITLKADVYTISTAAGGTIHLNKNGQSVGAATIKAGQHITISSDANGITINGEEGSSINSLSSTVAAAATNGASVTTAVGQTAGANLSYSATFKLVGGDGIAVTTNGTDEIIVTADVYSISARNSSAIEGKSADIVLNKNDSADDYITLKGGDNVKSISGEDGAIVIDTKDSYITDATVTELTAAQGGGFTVALTQSEGRESKSFTINPEITYGRTAQTAKFDGGSATLNVYTKDEIDGMLKQSGQTQDAMRFAGVITSADDVDSKVTAGVANGDTYKVSGAFEFNGWNLETGDLLIVTGIEENGLVPADKIDWQYIPAGDDTDNYKGQATVHGLQIVREGTTNEVVGALYLTNSDGMIELSDDAGTGTSRTVTVAHAKSNASTTAETAAAQEAKGQLEINAVVDVEYDEFGHVTAVKTKKHTVIDTDTHNNLKSVENVVVADGENAVSVSTTVTMNDLNDAKAASFKVGSENACLTVSASNNAIAMNLVWGSF